MSGADDAAEHAPLRIDVQRGQPTPEELAAVIAVVSEAYEREAASETVDDDAAAQSAWDLSARALRAPLRRELGWRRA